MLKSLYFRMSIVHYVGIVLLILNALVFTENLYSQVIQFVIAIVIAIHEFDENKNGKNLSKNIIKKLQNIDSDIKIDTSFASEYEIFHTIMDEFEKEKLLLKEDQILLQDAENVINRVKNGWYSDIIQSSTSNQLLNQFKDNVNEMISATKHHFVDVNKILEQYANNDYTQELKLDDVEKGGVFEALVNDINKLRDTITTMLVTNKQNGMTLQNSSDILLENVNVLNTASSEAATSLEEAAAALEEITSNISLNTTKVIEMARYGNDVKNSVTSGQELANKTTKAMDDIDQEVNAINEAITVIDQIAFQTNILSLNAAVEAATAGEAGKGFAVVAGEVRNLASRSAEAANEIKILVENATTKANNGKIISDKMIEGYNHLNESISKTLDMIDDVQMASKEQQLGIEQINDVVSTLDQQTQQNASVASHTKDIAVQTEQIAQDIVKEVNEKKFIGKDTVVGEKTQAHTHTRTTTPTQQKKEPTNTKQPSTPKQSIKKVVSNVDDDEWASF